MAQKNQLELKKRDPVSLDLFLSISTAHSPLLSFARVNGNPYKHSQLLENNYYTAATAHPY